MRPLSDLSSVLIMRGGEPSATMLLGIPPALGSWWAFVFVILLWLAITWRLLEEERFLSANLPGYTEYCRKTGYRLVPFAW